MMRSAFDAFLQERDVQLTLTQQRVAAILFDAAEQDGRIMEFLTVPAMGATFLFELLDAFFSSRKVFPRFDQVMTDEDWRAMYDALIQRANQIGR